MQAPTSKPEALAKNNYANSNGLMYDPADVRREVEEHVEIKNYRKYIADVAARNEEMAQERKRCHYRLRSIEKNMVINATKLGKYEAYLALLLQQIRQQIISGKILDKRKEIFGES